ncbi:hypothetical protein Tco_0316520 [Tanacetum coccineum]
MNVLLLHLIERRDEKKSLDHLKQDQRMLVIKRFRKRKKVPQEEKQNVSYYVEPYEPPIVFPRRLEHRVEEALFHETIESLKKIRINHPLLKEIRQTDNYEKHMKDLVANKPKTEEVDEVRMNPRCSTLLQNKLPPKEHDPGSFILPSMGKIEPINMVIEMVDNTKCTPKGIVKNMLVKIDKFILPVNFVVLDMVGDFKIPIILGRPLLATAHAKVDISKNSISLEVGNENVIFKMRSSFTTTTVESVRAIKSETRTEDDKLMKNDYELFLEDKANEILGVVLDKLEGAWFNGTSEDEDNLEGRIDYLLGSVPEPFSPSVDLNIKSSKLLKLK